MFDLGYDPESTIQDADIEMMELRESAKRAEYLKKIGKCPHGWTGPDKNSQTGGFICHDCGFKWESREARDKWERNGE